MTMIPTLSTARLVLTGHRADDLDDLAAMWADPAVYAMIGGTPRSREEVWIRLLRSIGTWALFGYGSWVVRDRARDVILGEMGLIEARRAIVPAIDAPEMGWTLTKAAQGQGFAQEALTAILDWADAQPRAHTPDLSRTQCIINPDNAPSIRLAARIGYRALGEAVYHDAPIGLYERRAA